MAAKPRSFSVAKRRKSAAACDRLDVRGRKLGLGTLDLQLEVLRIEPRDDVAFAHAVADIDDLSTILPPNLEREIGLIARAHDADELAGGGAGFELDLLNLDRALRLRRRGRLRLAGGEQ